MKNIFVTIGGLVVFIVTYILSFLVLGFIASIPFVSTLLSWPSTPDFYVLSGVAATSGYATSIFLSKFANLSKNGKNIPSIVIGLLIIAFFGSEAIYRLTTHNGFTPMIGIFIFAGIFLIFES